MFSSKTVNQTHKRQMFSPHFYQAIILVIFACILSSSSSKGADPEVIKTEACSGMIELAKKDGMEKAISIIRECMNSKIKENKEKVINCPSFNKVLKFKDVKELEAFCKEKDAVDLVTKCFIETKVDPAVLTEIKSCAAE